MYQDHVSHLWVWVLPCLSSYVFLFPFGVTAFASWSLLFPLRGSAFLAVGLLERVDPFPDLIGVSKFHIAEIRSGWVSSLLRDLGVLTYHKEGAVCLLTRS